MEGSTTPAPVKETPRQLPSPDPANSTLKPTPTEIVIPTIYLSSAVPAQLSEMVRSLNGFQVQIEPEGAVFQLAVDSSGEGVDRRALWTYALVGAFPTVEDGVSFEQLMSIWAGSPEERLGSGGLYVTAETLAGFSEIWGAPGEKYIRIANNKELIDLLWVQKNSLAIVPFEEIIPRLKVLQVDGISPLDPKIDIDQYPLTLSFTFSQGDGEKNNNIPIPKLPASNRDPDKFTTVILTGTTALAREIAAKMEENGVEYPARDIGDWLRDADITHISNEVSFDANCPPAIPVRKEMRFCSNPKYIGLLDVVGADLIELTGNHNLDWGAKPFIDSINLYKEHGMQYYGGGLDLAEAQKALIIMHAGTRLAFIGCNIAGPESAWATDQTPGAAPCDLEKMASEVRGLRDEGILPIVTFQHYEVDDFMPMNLTRQHFQAIAEAGAVIVSGSQAHFPHGFGFYGDAFMHYGLGNLFFDQMYEGNRREFIDRHIFYDGRYLGVELLTAMLEDSSRPRPMTAAERTQMLTKYFEVSGW